MILIKKEGNKFSFSFLIFQILCNLPKLNRMRYVNMYLFFPLEYILFLKKYTLFQVSKIYYFVKQSFKMNCIMKL